MSGEAKKVPTPAELVEALRSKTTRAVGAPLSKEHIVEITTKLLKAVGFIHENDMLHRDISPDNVLIIVGSLFDANQVLEHFRELKTLNLGGLRMRPNGKVLNERTALTSEDIAICRLLKRHGRPACLREKVTTSSRRWDRHGAWRTIFLMWRLRAAYFFGADPRDLAIQYGYRPR